MNAYYFREDKTGVLGAIKAQLPFSEGKYQLLFREIKFRSHRCHFKRPQNDMRKQKTAF